MLCAQLKPNVKPTSIVSSFLFLALTHPLISNADTVDYAKSKITATFKQMGVSVETTFNTFEADINYDAKNLKNTYAKIIIDMKSFDLGDPQYNKDVQKPEWFHSAKYPQATFTTDSVHAISDTDIQASGQLTIKGKSQSVVVPIHLKKDGNVQVYSGELPIKRNDYQIGEGEWVATDLVADEVIIRFNIVTTQP